MERVDKQCIMAVGQGGVFYLSFATGMVGRARAYVTVGMDLTSPGHDLHSSTQFPCGKLTDTRHKQTKI